MKRLLRGILSALLSASVLLPSAGAFAENEAAGEESYELTAPVNTPRESMIFLQDNMRAVFLTPNADYDENSDLSELCSEIIGYGMNGVIINSTAENEEFYSTDISDNSDDILSSMIKAAHNSGLSAYLTFDVNSLVKRVIEEGGGLKEGFSAAAHKFAMKYVCEGIILCNYYTEDSPEMYAEYLRSGSGIGYENWLYEINRYIFRTVCEVVRKTTNMTAAGALIEDMWANAPDTEEGSDTNDEKQALYDGHCDTKKYIEDGSVDFAVIKAYGSTEDHSLNFKNVVSWWYELCEKSGAKCYVCHLNERIGSRAGWNEDQLLRQLTTMKDNFENIGGSSFNSLSALRENVLDSAVTLKKYFDEQINTATIFEGLTMVTPTAQSFVTYDQTVKFMGTFDPNFDVYFDGRKIELNEVGNFLIQKDLNVGWNSFVIEHKGKKINYAIERRVEVLQSVGNTSDIVIDGGTKVTLSAVAYTGSSVTATINGRTVKLKEKSVTDGVKGDSYSEFTGTYKAPKGIVGQKQYLGEITFYGTYMGFEGYATGGTVTIEAEPEPEPPKTNIKVEMIPNQSAAGTGEIVGRIDPIVSEEEYVTYVKVINNNTDVLDANTTGSIPTPDFSQMPAGTLDYYKSTSEEGYITTTSGRRYREDYVTTFTDTGLGYNALTVDAVGNYGGKSFITLSLDYKASFNVTTSQYFVEGYDGPYGVDHFNAQYVYITFDNVTSVTALPSFNTCTLFSAGEWETTSDDNGIPKFRMRLTLRQAGIYSGVTSYYDGDGKLQLMFPVPTKSLAGQTIVISPGHGVNENGGWDPGAIGQVTEQEINLGVARMVVEELEAMGANVVRLRNEETFTDNRDRPRAARLYDADMFIELHSNAARNTDAHGTEAYYFTPWSQPLASAIERNLSSCLSSLYDDGTDSSRGAKYSYWRYTLEQGFPCVLVEMGFVTNDTECLIMANPENQRKMAKAIANGVYEYFARSDL